MTTNDGCRADVRKARAEAARVDTSLTEAEWTRLRHAAGNRGDLGPIAEEFDRILADRLATDTAAPEGAFFVSAGVEAALTEAARTGRDINIAGALYRKVNHGLPTAPVAVEGVETVEVIQPTFPLANRFTVGERCLIPGRDGSYPDHSKNRWGHVARIDRRVETRVIETLVVAFDDGEERGINPDVIAHGTDWRYTDPSPVEPETSEPEGGESCG